MKSYFILFEHRMCIFTPVKWRPYEEIILQKCVSGWVHIEDRHTDTPLTFRYIHVAGSDLLATDKDIDLARTE